MICTVCGQEYGLAHHCAGVPAASVTPEEAAPAPEGFAPLYFLRLAFKIVCWDDVSIRRASRDSRALFYGSFLWVVTATFILLLTIVPQVRRTMHGPAYAQIIGLAVGVTVGLALMGIITFVQLGLCHLIAKWFFGGSGTLVAVMRPLLLGWFVNVLILIPVIGTVAGAVAWTAVLMLSFEEVDRIERLQAFFISAGINVCFLLLQFAALPVRH